MANSPAPAQHAPASHPAAPKAAPAPQDAPPPVQIEMGGSGTATADFKDAAGGDVQIDSSEWTSTGSVTVEADDKNPLSAKLTPVAPGPGTVTVTGTSALGSAQASTSVTVIDKIGAPVSGTIDIAAQAPTKAKAK